jgi:hypothetical protein
MSGIAFASIAHATRVRFQPSVLPGCLKVEFTIPLEIVGLAVRQIETLTTSLSRAAVVIATARDEIADEQRGRGICPWCSELRGPEGHKPECPAAS